MKFRRTKNCGALMSAYQFSLEILFAIKYIAIRGEKMFCRLCSMDKTCVLIRIVADQRIGHSGMHIFMLYCVTRSIILITSNWLSMKSTN